METRICKLCGEPFEPYTENQVFCSQFHQEKYWRRYGKTHIYEEGTGPVIREFQCKQCGKTVRVRSEKDNRAAFCSGPCSRRYFRHRYDKRKRDWP